MNYESTPNFESTPDNERHQIVDYQCLFLIYLGYDVTGMTLSNYQITRLTPDKIL